MNVILSSGLARGHTAPPYPHLQLPGNKQATRLAETMSNLTTPHPLGAVRSSPRAFPTCCLTMRCSFI